jgi:hypothetical protein
MTSNPEGKRHSYLAASSCERWWNCPGSAKAAQEYPSEPSIYTAEGTVAHKLANYGLLLKWTRRQLDEKIGETEICDGFVVKVTEEMCDAIWVFLNVVRSRVTPASEVHLEEEVDIKEINEILFRTPDVVIIDHFVKLTVIDFKYGAGKAVSVFQNKQLLDYALAWFLKPGVDVDEIEIIISQPRIDEAEKVFTLNGKALRIFRSEYEEKVKEALLPDAPRKAGIWCRSTFCPAFARCEEAHAFAQALVAGDFSQPPEPKGLPVAQIQHILNAAEFLTGWLDKVKDHAKEMLLKGESIPGYKLVKGWGHRKYASEEAVINDFGYLGEKLYEKNLISPPKLEKVLGKEKKKLEPYVYKPETGLCLVDEFAKGDAVIGMEAADDFTRT